METRKTILIVDDEPSMRLLLQAELEDEGYRVLTAATGEEALDLFDRQAPDLVALDIKMPGMGGIRTLERLRERSLQVPVIMLTAYPEYRNDFNTWSSDDYVVKSSDLTELKDKIRFHLNRKEHPHGSR